MERKIKFRALNSKNEFIYGLPYIDEINKTIYFDGYNNRLCWRNEKGQECNQPYKNGTLMQFTGVKDRNDKEIYEKDIITYTTFYDDEVMKGVIDYNEEKGCYGILLNRYLKQPEEYPFNENPFFNEYRNRFSFLYKCGGKGYHYGIENIEIIEVIGNIYETPNENI